MNALCRLYAGHRSGGKDPRAETASPVHTGHFYDREHLTPGNGLPYIPRRCVL